MSEPIGPDNMQIKHTSVVDIEPFSADFGISGAQGVLQWIQDSWKKQFSRRNGQITHANFDLDQVFTHEFNDALITETTFPTLDGSVEKDAAYLKLKFQPETIVSKKQDGGMIQSNLGPNQKMWLCSGFRLNIDGLSNIDYTNKIESFTIKQSIKKFYTGYDRFPTVEPTRLEFPNLNGTIGLGYADDLIGWYQQYVVDDEADPAAQKTGSLEFLAPDRVEVIFRLDLYEVGIGITCRWCPARRTAIRSSAKFSSCTSVGWSSTPASASIAELSYDDAATTRSYSTCA